MRQTETGTERDRDADSEAEAETVRQTVRDGAHNNAPRGGGVKEHTSRQ